MSTHPRAARPAVPMLTAEPGCKFRVIKRYHQDLAAEVGAILGLLKLPEAPSARLIDNDKRATIDTNVRSKGRQQ